jgi:exodeoxyribonuclease VII large subunit
VVATPVSVSALAHLLKSHVGEFFGDVHVSGEISNFTAHRSGHWYFAIKDQGAVINCAMFRGSNARCRFQPRTGDQVVLNGGMDMYAPQGRLNLIVRSMREDGAGDLQRQLEELKKRLSDEGLFDPAHKQPLPGLPQCIGVATSPTGAAFQDILKVLSRRFPGRHVLLSPCKVQGDGSAAAVVQAIERLVADGRADVIIFGRGGGSPEDLMAFNDESLARAILACPVPTISAVGHEVDVSISDLVADVRAATPSHAAELVVPERDGILAYVDELGERLSASVRRDVEKRREKLAHITLRTPEQRVADGRLRLDDVSDRLYRFTEVRLTHERSRLVHLGGRLDAMSPLRVLERGYAVVQVESGAVTAAAALKMDDQVRLRFHDGERQARITDEA